MPAAIDATPGGAAANAYLTVEDADAYLAGRVDASAWTAADADTRIRAVISATRRLDQERYQGGRYTAEQALEWPRWGVVAEGAARFQAIPQKIKTATAELALALLAAPGSLDASGLEGFEEVKVGPLAVTPSKAAKPGALPEAVAREIRPLLANLGGSVRLVRG